MTIDDIVVISRDALYTICITSAPVLLVSLVVGLIISIFQTVTSIQEQTLTFVPKVLAIFVALLICGHWMMNNMTDFMTRLWSDFTVYIREYYYDKFLIFLYRFRILSAYICADFYVYLFSTFLWDERCA